MTTNPSATSHPLVKIRSWRISDVNDLSELANNRNIWNNVRDYFPHPYTRKDAEEWISLQLKKERLTNFAVEYNGRLCGGISFIPKDDIYRCSAEIGYWIGEPYWGKGIATEAVRQVMAFIQLNHPAIIRVYAEVFAWNEGSEKVLQKNGFYRESIRRHAVIKNDRVGDDSVWVWLRQQQEI
jgi:RimJ/RimL family protein N-acetyltransferase